MRTLRNLLQDQDQGFLRIIAELWGFDPPRGSVREAAAILAENMLEPDLLAEIVASLPSDSSAALFELVRLGGSCSWPFWERKHGRVRTMGPGRRDREQPWREPTSSSEALWYRGLLGRAFIDTVKGPEEIAYLPRDVMEQLELRPETKLPNVLEAITPPDQRFEAAATLIDDCTTLLAALRRQTRSGSDMLDKAQPLLQSQLLHPESLHLCLALTTELGLLCKGTHETVAEVVPDFLLSDRMQSLQHLYNTWKKSLVWNDLSALPGLSAGGNEWPNDPVLPRKTLLRWIAQLNAGEWYSINDLVRAVYQEDPAFQRPAGQFDTWYLLDTDGVALDGIEHWYAIEGALLRSLITGPLRWFGAVQLGSDVHEGIISAFAPTKLFGLLETPRSDLPPVEEKGKAIIQSDGSIAIPRLAPRSVRYQLARILEWEGLGDQAYHYRLSSRAIKRALQQGLDLQQVISILKQASGREIPPAVLESLRNIEIHAFEARVDRNFLLRVSDPALLDKLLAQRSTQRFIHERLNPTTAIIRHDHWEKLVRAAVAIGILIDGPAESPAITTSS